jgi:hypothetical protein
MTLPHVNAAEFIEQLASVARRLAAKGIVVSKLDCDWGWFRSWQLITQQGAATERYYEELRGAFPLEAKGPDVLNCWWWGDRDRVLVIDESPTIGLSCPNQWTRLLKNEFDSCESALTFVEAFLTDRLGS